MWGLPIGLPWVLSQGAKDLQHFWCDISRDAVAEPRGKLVARERKQALRRCG